MKRFKLSPFSQKSAKYRPTDTRSRKLSPLAEQISILSCSLALLLFFCWGIYSITTAPQPTPIETLTTSERLEALLNRDTQDGTVQDNTAQDSTSTTYSESNKTDGNTSHAATSKDAASHTLSTASVLHGCLSHDGNILFATADIPTYRGDLYVPINDNLPFFTQSELTTSSFERYSDLDDLGRCGTATACIGQDIMPTEARESISSVTPTGWEQASYDTDLVSGGYLYNRAHLIGFQLTGENANKENLITGTRAFNVEAMLPFENMVADYITETGNHVYYRVTPIFCGNDLLAQGVLIEAESVEDDGEGILFNMFCYNVQDGITLDYATGESHLA